MPDNVKPADFLAAGIKAGDIVDVSAIPGFVETTSGALSVGQISARRVRVTAVTKHAITFEPVDG